MTSAGLWTSPRIAVSAGRTAKQLLTGGALLLLACQGGAAQAPPPRLYLAGYAHLDTQWRWEMPQVIEEYLPNTMRENFRLLAKYPHYIFNFTGSNRYRLMKEYYPKEFATLRNWVAKGRWFPAGSCVEEGDQLMPSAESLFRQVLYANQFFRREFHKASCEYMQPDSFGFPASLPSILAHAGLRGMSTQKLVWGSAAPGGPGATAENTPSGIPFNLGMWQGPDGRSVAAAFNPESYNSVISTDLSRDPQWLQRVGRNGDVSGLGLDLHYYGVGDVGGAPLEQSVRIAEALATKGKAYLPPPRKPGETAHQYALRIEPLDGPGVAVGRGPLQVVSATLEQIFVDLSKRNTAGLPRYQGDLLLTQHSAGSLTSQAYHKRWNRQNELLGGAAEELAVGARMLTGASYPGQALLEAWTLVLAGQFHDTMSGTCTPRAYTYAWNDDLLARNRFASTVEQGAQALASDLDTRGPGVPVVVFNPLGVAREDIVEISWPGGPVRVLNPQGRAVLSQITAQGHLLFLAKMPSVGLAVYHVQPDASGSPGELTVSETGLENQRYRVQLNRAGEVCSIYDKALARELLREPLRLAFQTENPRDWPAWNMDWEDRLKAPRAYVDGPPRIRVRENGPARVAVTVERDAQVSHFEETVRLSAGDAGNRVEFSDCVDWKTLAASLKATFRLTVSNPRATYNWDVGTIARGNNDPCKYEVPTHQWIDLTDGGGKAGVTLLTDCKYGSDKPDDETLRLTLLFTPGLGEGGNSHQRYNAVQATQDWGHHEMLYGLSSHPSDWRQADTDWQAFRLNQPPLAFTTSTHPGRLGKSVSLLGVSSNRVRVLALKKAEESEEIIVRLVEMAGLRAPDVRVRLASPILAAREVNAQEQPLGPALVSKGVLVMSLSPSQPRTFALTVKPAPSKRTVCASVPLAFDRAVSSLHDGATVSGFNAAGETLPAEMLPSRLQFGAVHFDLGQPARANALVCRGQTLDLPAGKLVYLLAAAAEGDETAIFKVGDVPHPLTIQSWGGFVGQWDRRVWRNEPVRYLKESDVAPSMQFTGEIKPGYIKPAQVAWACSHRHRSDGSSVPYSYSYLFAYPLDMAPGARRLTLPNNPNIRMMAISVSRESPAVQSARLPSSPLAKWGQGFSPGGRTVRHNGN